MIEREITDRLVSLFGQYPFVTVTGPRQSGKTTLCRTTFPDLQYANLEAPDQREFAESDPRGFLAQFPEGAIIDEIQHVPMLLSYLQVIADERRRNSLFVLTGSEQFRLSNAISQSLAGRTALLRLLPFSLAERQRMGAENTVDEILFSGFYPRILDQGLDARQALGDYFETYVERDVRRLGEIRNISSFRRFVRLCAGRIGQLINLSSLGSDAGVSHTTARHWITVLEASYIIFQLPPFFSNIRKRLVKAHKMYFYDVGLASFLMGIENPKQVATHPLRGHLFENMMIAEVIKHRFNRGRDFNLSFFRDSRGLECDLFYQTGYGIHAVEIKSGSTISSDYFSSINKVADLIPEVSAKTIVYGGTARQLRTDSQVVPPNELVGVIERLEATQEIVDFVRERRGPLPDNSDVETLDSVFRLCVRPTLDGLDSLCNSLEDLFRSSSQSSSVSVDGLTTQSSILLKTENWENTKNQLIVERGFRLEVKRQFKLSHVCRFTRYTGAGGNRFDLGLAVEWELGPEGLTISVLIQGKPVHRLSSFVPYQDLLAYHGDVDRNLSSISRLIREQIVSLSGENDK